MGAIHDLAAASRYINPSLKKCRSLGDYDPATGSIPCYIQNISSGELKGEHAFDPYTDDPSPAKADDAFGW